ncbi:MAG: YjgP/YjgQ family permease [Chitinophagia bacterium]|nr:YjgP/YjgQ family permease [Chitinophagia bacterium]
MAAFFEKVADELRIKKLDWYIIGKFLSTFFFAILVLAVISCVIDYSEKVDNIVQKKAPLMVVLNYYKNFVPHITALLFPLFIFIATIFFTSKIAYKSEIIAILAGGVSFQRFLRPYIIGGAFLGLVSYLANHYVIPVANEQRVAFEDKYINDGNYVAPGENVHLAIARDYYIFLQYFNFKTKQGNHFTAEKRKGTLLTEKLMADDIRWDSIKHTWVLSGIVLRRNDTLKESVTRISEMSIPYPFGPADLMRNEALKEALTTPQLEKFIATEKLRGREDLNTFIVEKERRTAQPFAGLILTIIGACIASRKIRGGSGFHLALGIAISAVYILFLQLSTTFSIKAGLNPVVAVWIPNIIFGLVAYYLYRRQIK